MVCDDNTSGEIGLSYMTWLTLECGGKEFKKASLRQDLGVMVGPTLLLSGWWRIRPSQTKSPEANR